MNRVLIVEGADGAGKTQLCNTIATEHGFQVLHTDKPKPGTTSKELFDEYSQTLFDALHADQPVVFDRHYLGELVYGPVMRGGSLLTEIQQRLLERVCRANDVKVVLCVPPWDIVLHNWHAKQEDYIKDTSSLLNIYHAYKTYLDSSSFDYYSFDYEVEDIAGWLFTPKPTLPKGTIGSPTARLLIVGERVNTNVTTFDWAFYDGGGCSGFLNEALAQSLIPEQDLAFTNAMTSSCFERDFSRLLPRLPNLKVVVALGKVAERILTNQRIGFKSLPHPAFVKRFHSANNTYAQDLRTIYQEATCQVA